MRQPLLLALLLTAAPIAAEEKRLQVQVDPRVELLSIIFRLAGNPEYNHLASKSPYSKDVEDHFKKWRRHAVVERARVLRRDRGVSFDAVMSMAVHLKDANTLAERVPFDTPPERLDKRWKTDEARTFVYLARHFVEVTQFAEFFKKHRKLYEASAARVRKAASGRDHLAWFDAYFGGEARAKCTVMVGMLNGNSNYGVGVRYPDGKEELTPVIGIYRWDENGLPVLGPDFLSLLIHEIAHSYANPLVDDHAKSLQRAGEAIFPRHAAIMRRQAYPTWRIMFYESLVRACVVRYLHANEGADAAKKQAAFDATRGFAWTADLAALLATYEKQRDKYKTLGDFMPKIAEFFDKRAGKLAEAPRLASIEPANGATEVDPDLKAIVIRFDRPMLNQWSVVKANAPFPKVTGKVFFDKAMKVLTIPVALEPITQYRFFLNSDALTNFRSAQGVPLAPVEIAFKTRARK
ncbi:MAG: DUF4932 domain-containing protein [Planctomycetota bacterium]|jgi:hypothetical protein